ncbi:DsbA family protein [Nonomuraea antimicrobica]
MRIEIWADVVSGWAHVGKRRLEKALAGWQGEAVEVVWRPYQIDPSAPAGTLEAHRLIALAYEKGGAELQSRVLERVLHAHFVEVRDISDPAVLTEIATEAGLAEEAGHTGSGAAPQTPPGAELTRELLLIGKAKGVHTSPTIVVGDLALEGAQPPEAIRAFLEEASERTPRRLPAEVERLRHAESLLDQRDPLGALTLLRPLMREHGDDRGVRMLAARAYFGSAQLNRARTALESLVSESPDDSYARHLLGRTLQRQGRHEEAATHLALAATMTPDYAT